jgi:uncharacterized protein (TIGR03067 family)
MRRTVCLLAALLVLPSLGSDSPKEYDGATEEDELRGEWRVVIIEDETRILDNGALGVRTFRSGKWTYSNGQVSVAGAYTADARYKPPRLDMVGRGANEGLRSLCIYRIDGDTLRLAFPRSGTDRPTTFTGDVVLVTLKRVAK